jgi:segregation and condensation protein A
MREELEFYSEERASADSYLVKLENFKGPLDLLLYLIKKEEIDIYDIPIAKITKQYLEYVELMERLNLEVAGEFILMAATLIRIKTKMLLPAPPQEEEQDPRAGLVQALLELQKHQQVAQQLAEREREQILYHLRQDFSYLRVPEPVLEFTTPNLYELLKSYQSLLERQIPETFHAVTVPQVSVEERIERVLSYLHDSPEGTFEELCRDVPLRIYLVATFLALLELIRRGWVGFRQAFEFGPILVWRTMKLRTGGEDDQ